MTQSQSRYSIVERLTQTKLDIMKEKSDMNKKLRTIKENINNAEKDLECWEIDIKSEIKKTRRQKQKQIEDAKSQYDAYTEHIKEVEQSIDERIMTIDQALESIEEISKTSPTINK